MGLILFVWFGISPSDTVTFLLCANKFFKCYFSPKTSHLWLLFVLSMVFWQLKCHQTSNLKKILTVWCFREFRVYYFGNITLLCATPWIHIGSLNYFIEFLGHRLIKWYTTKLAPDQARSDSLGAPAIGSRRCIGSLRRRTKTACHLTDDPPTVYPDPGARRPWEKSPGRILTGAEYHLRCLSHGLTE